MTSNPYPQNPAEFDPLIGGTVRRVGINREGYPYLVIDKTQQPSTSSSNPMQKAIVQAIYISQNDPG